MGVFSGPKIAEDGLVLALDAGNTKSYPGSGTSWINMFSSEVPNSVGIITCVSILNNTNKFFGAYYNSCAGYSSGTIFDNRPPSISDLNTILQENINCKSYNIGTWDSSYRGIIGAYGGSGDLCTLRFTGWGQNATIYAGVYLNASSRQLRLSGDVSGSPVTFTSPTGGYISFTLTSDPADVTFTNPGGGGDPMYVYWMGAASNNTIVLSQPTYSSDDGGTLVFDGTDDYVILNDFDKASYGTTNFSLSLWFNADSGSYKSLFQIANSLDSHGPWIALISYSSGLRVYVNNDYRMDVPYTQDAWNNFVLTFDSSGSGLWTAYLNGSSVSTYTGPIGTNGGSATYLGHAYNNSYFDGKISNFSVQQKTLTAAEVQQNYNALKGRYGF